MIRPAAVAATAALIAITACGSGGSSAPTSTSPEPATTAVAAGTVPESTVPPTATSPTTSIAAEAPTTTSASATSTTTATTAAGELGGAPTVESLLSSGTFVNLAHAGGDQAAPHSTRFAFAEAVAAGATALELDVQLTADGVLVVQHDDTVDKTTEATGPVADLTLDEIQALDNAYWFSPECWPCHDRPTTEYVYRGVRTGDVPPPDGYTADDFRVPTFREIATAFPDLPLDVEIKGTYPDALPVVEQLATELEELGRNDSTVVVSFDDLLVDAFHERAPDVAVSPGLGRLTAWFLDGAELESHFRVLQLPPFQGELAIVDDALVERIHDEGRVVWVWMDDAEAQENTVFYVSLLEMGVDGIIAGRPGDVPTAPDG